MDVKKARVLLKYVRSNSIDDVVKGLREIKKRIVFSNSNISIFKELGIASTLKSLLISSNENILQGTLSILSVFLQDEQFRFQIYLNGAMLRFLEILSSDKKEDTRWRSCRLIGIQSLNRPSCRLFHARLAVPLILDFAKAAKSDRAKESVIKALRLLGSSSDNCKRILKHDAIATIAEVGINPESTNLSQATLKTLIHFMQFNHAPYYEQLLNGTNNFKSLIEVYEKGDVDISRNVLEIFINVTLFTIQSCAENELLCMKIVEYLCYEKVLLLIVSNLKEKLESGQPYSTLVIVLCGLCQKSSTWKATLQRVLHEKFWYQLTECNGITLIVTLLERHMQDAHLLLPILQGLLGVEIIHSLRVFVLKTYITSKLLSFMKAILETSLAQIDCSSLTKREPCGHSPIFTSRKRKSLCGENKRQLRKFIKKKSRSLESSQNFAGSSTSLEPFSPPTNFSPSSDSAESSSTCPFEAYLTMEFQMEVDDVSGIHVKDTCDEETSDLSFDEQSNISYWTTIIDCIFRLLFQIVSIKDDVTTICKEFFPMVYKYINNAQVVHPSAISVITEMAKKASCIQPLLDTNLIPSLAVVLKGMTTSKDCSQCLAINKGVDDFLLELGKFFTHRHQYGRYEISDRLRPSKAPDVRKKCLLAIPHIIKCPRLMNSLLQQEKGVQDFLKIFEDSENDPELNLLCTSALSSLIYNLKVEHGLKKQNWCMFCVSNFDSIYGDAKFTKEEKQQLLILTKLEAQYHFDHKLEPQSKPDSGSKKDPNLCLLESSPDKNLSLKCNQIVIEANREILAEKNEVFRAMLSGHFSESALTEIEIKDMNAQCLEMVVHFLYGCTCQVFKGADLDSYLQLIFISQMYFIPNLGILAIHYLSSLIIAEDVYQMLDKAFAMFGDEILEHLICELISKEVGGVIPSSCQSWFLDILNSSFKDKFLKHFNCGLLRLLKMTSVICSCDIFVYNQRDKMVPHALAYC